MVCVIVDHSKRSSLLSWFSYERFWLVTAAEVFVVLSGVALGMAYGPKLLRDGWLSVMRALARRALILYLAFVAVTVSILAISLAGIDVRSVTAWNPSAMLWFYDPRLMSAADWRDLLFLRYGPWAFEIIGLYVWLVLAAGPCLLILRAIGWRWLLAISWALYIVYRLVPVQLTAAEFETVFPILAWQLLFVHGITIGYHRKDISTRLAARSRSVSVVIGVVSVTFMAIALSNPSVAGPSWLQWGVVSPERFTALYDRYFTLSDLGIGRLLNLAVALPFGYAVLSWGWLAAERVQGLFVTLGQRSLSAFVLHVYGLLLLDRLPATDVLWINTVVQLALIAAIAFVLLGLQRWGEERHRVSTPTLVPVS